MLKSILLACYMVHNQSVQIKVVVLVGIDINYPYVLILIRIFKVDFTGWSNLTAIENHGVEKPLVYLV